MNKSISMFFPTFNEKDNIGKVVSAANSLLSRLTKNYEIIIIDDGSTDGTGELADELAKNNEHINVIHHEKNEGYGVALRTGFYNSNNELVCYTDTDQQFDVKELKRLLPFITDYDIVIGYRIKRKDPIGRIIASKIFNLLVKLLLKIEVRDVDCGFKLCKKKVLNRIELTCQRSTDVELLFKANLQGFKIKEVGIQHHPRKKGKSEASSGSIHIIKPKIILISIKELLCLRFQFKKISVIE